MSGVPHVFGLCLIMIMFSIAGGGRGACAKENDLFSFELCELENKSS